MQEPTPRRSDAWRALLLFVLATLLLTWPIAVSLDQPVSSRGDYYSNIWNAWWLRTALFELHTSPYATDHLHFPDGISLGKHTLSPVNAVPGALLAAFLGPYVAINLVILAHFALSAWCLYLLASYLTGCRSGSLLAGLLYSFNPFHYYYLAELNVASLGFLPLALLCFLRTWREGGWRNLVLTAGAVGLLAGSSSYYLVYAFLLAGLLVLAGRLEDPRVGFVAGARRMAIAGVAGALVVLVVEWPLIRAVLFEAPSGARAAAGAIEAMRVNDVLGYGWVGPPDRLRVSWPSMLGYGTLLVLALGFRGWIRQRFWLLVLGVGWLLSLGPSLHVAGVDTGFPLPYAWLQDVPVLSMLRKPDRCFALVLLVVSLLLAFAWRDVEARLRGRGVRAAASVGAGALIAIELTAVPFARFDDTTSPLLERLAADTAIDAVVELPALPGHVSEGRYLLSQVVHGKKLAQGYTTDLAMTMQHARDAASLVAAYRALDAGDGEKLRSILTERKLDGVILHKTELRRRAPGPLHRTTVWKPFVSVRRELVGGRQAGPLEERPVDPAVLRRRLAALTSVLGPPLLEDDRIAVFRARRD